MQYFAIFFLIEQFLFGLILLRFFDKKDRLNDFEKIIFASIIGVISGFFVILISSLILRKLDSGIIVGSILELILIILQAEYLKRFFKKCYEGIVKLNIVSAKKNLIYSALVLPVIYIWLKVALDVLIMVDGDVRGILVGWGDIAYHFSMIQHFAQSYNFALEQPIFSGASLTYPFLINFASAVFIKFGFSILWAFHLPVIILGILGLSAFYSLALRIFRSGFLAILVLIFVLFGSGLGFLWFIEDAQNASLNSNQSIFETLDNPPHEYTHLDNRTGGKPQSFDSPQNIVWIVPAISFLSHQRSFVWGFALFIVFLSLLWLYREDETFWRLGLIFGLFPLVHGHTFFALCIALAGWFLWQKKNIKSWIYFGIVASAIALPALLYLNQGMEFLSAGAGKSFFRWQFGWMTCEHNQNWFNCVSRAGTDTNAFIFWSKNFGFIFWIWFLFVLFFIVRLIYLQYKNRKEAIFPKNEIGNFLGWILIPSVLLFAVPNVLILQPWDFDNNKVLFYWWIMASFIVVGVIGYFIKINYFKKRLRIVAILLAVIISFLSVFSGLIDVRSRIINSPKNHYGYWGKADKDLADWVTANTEPDSVFLTDASPTSPITIISGRSIYLGFTGWLWSQGVNYADREEKIRKILNNGNVNLACKEKIDYILINNGLTKTYPAGKLDLFKKMDVVYQDSVSNLFLIKLDCKN